MELVNSLETYEVYKKWRQGKGSGGFAGFSNWMLGGKIVIDIGETGDGGLKSNTVCFIDTVDLLAYLYAEVNDTVAKFYPSVASDYGMQTFGGGKTSRVFTVKAVEGKPGTRWFKCGEYEAKIGAQGAIQPDYSKKISENSIQMKPEEIAQLYQAVLLSQQAFESTWIRSGLSRSDFMKKMQEELRNKRAANAR